jgi:putative oxidoreductase
VSIDIGLLVLRALIGFVLFAHATQKLTGWFSGPGLDKAGLIFESLGQFPGRPMAVLASICELTAAAMLLLGLATPLGAAVAMGTMLVAGAAMTAKAGTPWNSASGGEYPLVLAALAGGIAFTGAGSWSIDELWNLPWAEFTGSSAAALGVAAVGLAVLASLGPIARTRPAQRAADAQTRG